MVTEEEDLIIWQDLLDEVAAGRTSGLVCPFCRWRRGPEIEQGERGRVAITCPKCKKFIEGSIGSEEPGIRTTRKMGHKDFLGKGWRFPIDTSRQGRISTSVHEENVRQAIFIILGTAPGERINAARFRLPRSTT